MLRIIQRTERDDRGIYYRVIVDGRTIWGRRVDFGRNRYYRPGGGAFVAAARAQEKRAAEIKDE